MGWLAGALVSACNRVHARGWLCRLQYNIAQKKAMELAAKIDKGGPDTKNEMQVRTADSPAPHGCRATS